MTIKEAEDTWQMEELNIGTGKTIIYNGNSSVTKTGVYESIKQFFKEIFLPHGYPLSVSEDYLNYQLYDTLQAFCSSLTGILATKSILEGVGVGDANSSVAVATLAWILKDGTGMCARILFAWYIGSAMDHNPKKWRFFADVLNDAALMIELVIASFKANATILLCASTTMKSIVGVVGGSTRAAITQHQAVRGNVCDVMAKDGSQETLVNLIAYLVGIVMLDYVSDVFTTWIVFIVLTVTHIWANYRAVRALIMNVFNEERLNLVLDAFYGPEIVNTTPKYINAEESLWPCFQLDSHRIIIGASLSTVARDEKLFRRCCQVYAEKPYVVVPMYDMGCTFIVVKSGCLPSAVLEAYVVAFRLERSRHDRPASDDLTEAHTNTKFDVNVCLEWMKSNGWSIDTHQLRMGEFQMKCSKLKDN